ncbi:hypothetical protein IWW57_003960 [Coemansia sp. S610]|nr:hypothetical protein IWW57_003960 [Coemansia sp. S610]
MTRSLSRSAHPPSQRICLASCRHSADEALDTALCAACTKVDSGPGEADPSGSSWQSLSTNCVSAAVGTGGLPVSSSPHPHFCPSLSC